MKLRNLFGILILAIVLFGCEEEKVPKDVEEVEGEGKTVYSEINEDVVFTDSTETSIDVVSVDSTSYERNVYSLSVEGEDSIVEKGNVIFDTSQVGRSNIWVVVEGSNNKKSNSFVKAIEGGLDCIYEDAKITLTTESNRAKEASPYSGKISSKNEYEINFDGWSVLGEMGLLEGTNPKWINKELSIPIKEGKKLYDGERATVTVNSGEITINPSIDLRMVFRPEQAETSLRMGAGGVPAVSLFLSSVKKLHCTVYSEVDIDLDASVDMEGEVALVEESIKLGRFYFNVPVHTVDLSIMLELVARLEINADGSLNITPHFVSKNNFVSSMNYEGSFESPSFYSQNNCIKSSLEGRMKGNVGLKQRLEIVPRIEVYIYGVTGASSEFIPYEEFIVNKALSGNWDNRLIVGVDGKIGADISAFHTDLATAKLYSKDFKIKTWSLYNSPDSLERVSGNNQKGTVGKILSEKIVVRAVDSKDNPVSNVPVYFKPDENCGSVSQDGKVFTNSEGKASVDWTLGSKVGEQTLQAYLKNSENVEIENSRIEFKAEGEEDDFEGESGTFVDSRDGHEYDWVKIGDQIWMAENLAYLPEVNSVDEGSEDTDGSGKYYYVYGYNGNSVEEAKETENYKTYGVLYNWNAACESCPDGWHLPSDEEWDILFEYVSNDGHEGTEGMALKATSGWYYGNGTDDYGFSALPGKDRVDYRGWGGSAGLHGYFWSSTEYNGALVWVRPFRYNLKGESRIHSDKDYGFSVRCIKDE